MVTERYVGENPGSAGFHALGCGAVRPLTRHPLLKRKKIMGTSASNSHGLIQKLPSYKCSWGQNLLGASNYADDVVKLFVQNHG